MSEQNHSDSTESPSDTITFPVASRGGRTKRWVLVSIVALLVIGVVLWVVLRPEDRKTASNGPSVQVVRGPLTISITGNQSQVEAAKKKIIRNVLPWDVIIKKVVQDGTLVQKGDVIIQFECAQLEKEIEDADLALDKAQLDYDRATKDLELKHKEMNNSVHKAEQDLITAQEDFQRFNDKGGQLEIDDSEAKSKIDLAEKDLSLAKGKLDFKLRINKDPELKSPYSESEIKADRLNVDRLQRVLEKAVYDRKMLLKYEHPQKLRKLKSGMEDAKLELERAKLNASNQIAIAEADVKGKKTLLSKREDKLKELRDYQKELTVSASEPGLVVYDVGGNPWRSNGVTVEVGARITPRQQLMIIPDMSTLQIQTKVLEAHVNMLKPQETKGFIRLDVNPDEAIPGTVKWVAPLPDKQHWLFSSGVKMFTVVVEFDCSKKELENLKPGMTAQVELVLAELKDTLSVPIAAVFTEQDRTYCWKANGGNAEKVDVKVGQTNASRVQILGGLEQGDQVLLVPQETQKAPDSGADVPSSGHSNNGRKAKRS